MSIKQLLKKKPEPSKCEHTYKKYKQSIRVDNDKFDKTAYFVVSACDKCKDKIYTDYKIL
jgi:hypothetical protein